MARKALRVLLPASVAVLVASQWREIARYLKISQMSRGDGHPQAVPAGGKHAYTGLRRRRRHRRLRLGKPRRRPLLRLARRAYRPPPSLRERCSWPSSPYG